MKFNAFAFLGCFLMTSIFSSCNFKGEPVQTWSYDEVLFNQMGEKWNNRNLLNYSFEYSISDVIPNAVTGIVTVSDGVGFVELNINGLTFGDEGYEEELTRYAERNIKINFNSINEIYSYIKSVVNNRKQEYESKKLIHYDLNIVYDNENFVPSFIEETLSYKDDFADEFVVGDWDGSLYLKIKNFSLR